MPVLAPGTGASMWTPAAASAQNLVMWLDPSDTATLVRSGNAVSRCIDKSGTGNDATAASGAEPTTGTTRINGLHTLTFTTSKRLVRSGATRLPSTFCSIFAVHTASSSSVGTVIEIRRAGVGNPILGLLNAGSNSWFFRRRNDAGSIIASAGYTVANPTIGALLYDGANAIYRANGTQIDSKANSGTTTLDTVYIGDNQDVNSALGGSIGELLIFNRYLSILETLTVERYLSAKWAIPLTNGIASSPPLVFQ